MLYLQSGSITPERIHGAYVSDKEVKDVIIYLKAGTENEYLDEIVAPQHLAFPLKNK